MAMLNNQMVYIYIYPKLYQSGTALAARIFGGGAETSRAYCDPGRCLGGMC